MTGLDTNVLIRYVTQDDPKQTPLANRLIESLSSDSPGFVSSATAVGYEITMTFHRGAAKACGMVLIS